MMESDLMVVETSTKSVMEGQPEELSRGPRNYRYKLCRRSH